jgi:acyl-CoA reductase-like NAD-dependent aldehyde dehydrogenase
MKIQSINPANGEVISLHEPTNPDEISEIVARARKTQQEWAGLSVNERVAIFLKLKHVLEENADNLLQIIEQETGKLRTDGEAEVYDVIDAVDYYIEQLRSVKAVTSLSLNSETFADTDLVIDFVPYGVMGLIMPWNFPFYSPMMFVMASVIAGNSVVLKPSEYSSMVGLEIKELFNQAGFPENLVEVIIGDEEVGRVLVKSQVDKIFFVGSVEAGEDIIKNSGIKPVQLEAGGNSAALVFDDAEIEQAAQAIAWGGTYHSGQDCVGIKRVYVTQRVADAFLKRLVEVVGSLRPGVDYGPYIRPHQLEMVERRIEMAVKGGARLLVGGERLERSGFWLSPSVITFTDNETELVREETFGNVLPVKVVADEAEAIDLSNNSTYGLSTAVFTRNVEKAKSIAQRLESGMVFINDPFIAIPGWDHWTGWKKSGFGTVESKLMQCFKKKVVSINKQGKSRSFWYPYD